jgi:hypothetical protein
VFLQLASDPNPIAPAMVEGARSVGTPTFDDHNGRMMEGEGGASIMELRVRDGNACRCFVAIPSLTWTARISPCSRHNCHQRDCGVPGLICTSE